MRPATWLTAAAMLLLAAPAVHADSRITAKIDGPSTVKRGQSAPYYVTIRNAGSQTLGAGSSRIVVDLDAVPSSSASLPLPAFIGGTGKWSCRVASCSLASGSLLPPGATAAFAFPVQVLRSTTLDLDVTGTDVLFSRTRKSVRTSGTQVPVVYGLSFPATVSPRSGPIGFTLSEPTRVTVQLERISTRWRLRKRVGGQIVRSIRCQDKRPKVKRTTLVRKGKTRCTAGIQTLVTYSGTRGFNRLDVPQLRALPVGQRYRLRLSPRTRDGRQGRVAKSFVFKTTR